MKKVVFILSFVLFASFSYVAVAAVNTNMVVTENVQDEPKAEESEVEKKSCDKTEKKSCDKAEKKSCDKTEKSSCAKSCSGK